jgi:hypothetical protein
MHSTSLYQDYSRIGIRAALPPPRRQGPHPSTAANPVANSHEALLVRA